MHAHHHKHSTQPVSLTSKAASKLKELQQSRGKEAWGIRFAEKVGFCGQGYDYVMDFVPKPEAKDLVFRSEGFEIYVPDASLSKLGGSVIDFQDTEPNERLELLMREGFTVQNPNAKGPCPCACNGGFDC